MPLLKRVLKVTPTEAIVKWTGSGTDTLVLTTLISTGQTTDATCAVTIIDASVTSTGGGDCTVTRNSEVALQMAGNYSLKQSNSAQITIGENPTSNIAVSLTNTGTLILTLKKVGGFITPALP